MALTGEAGEAATVDVPAVSVTTGDCVATGDRAGAESNTAADREAAAAGDGFGGAAMCPRGVGNGAPAFTAGSGMELVPAGMGMGAVGCTEGGCGGTTTSSGTGPPVFTTS